MGAVIEQRAREGRRRAGVALNVRTFRRLAWLPNSLLLRVYLAGIEGRQVSRRIRRLLGGTELHRAWLLGFLWFFAENGVRYGPANPYNRYRSFIHAIP